MAAITRLPPLPSIQELIRLYKLRAMKQLSQNFLLDHNLSRRIVRAMGDITDGYVCEVGPGPGGITRALLETKAKQIAVIEKDARFMPSLELLNEASGGRMRILLGDVLKFDTATLFADSSPHPWNDPKHPNLHIVGNLPFSVSTILIIRWLAAVSNRSGAWAYGRVPMTLTFQKEVADRMVAAPGSDARCRLSVMCQYLCRVERRFTIRGRAFVPPPDVDVGVVRLVPLVEPLIVQPFPLVEKMMRHVFHYRQKMCKACLQTLFPPDRPDLTVRIVEMAGVDPTMKPFYLNMDDMRRLCDAYRTICDEEPGLFEYDYRSKENAAIWRLGVPSILL